MKAVSHHWTLCSLTVVVLVVVVVVGKMIERNAASHYAPVVMVQ